MKKLFDFSFEIEFYLRIAISFTIVHQGFYLLLHNTNLDFMTQVVSYWLVGSISFYGVGILIETGIKSNEIFRDKLTTRGKKIKTQPFPSFTAKGIVIGEIRSFIAALIILSLADLNLWL
jgi:hypothetical protein